MKKIGIPIKGVRLKDGNKLERKTSYRSVSQAIAARKKPKQTYRRGKG